MISNELEMLDYSIGCRSPLQVSYRPSRCVGVHGPTFHASNGALRFVTDVARRREKNAPGDSGA